ncbi:MAG TPA: universal stress protein [Noviherbaspirillum sp.]|uniref:universal stress protein n=1 Tax=Noviherbaspirillum sp. TaxID=1926288 RepID=UPI002B474D1B|nr:universal stress protein [Noviherbaspirillum sp.]HJV86943.1 universal stress protein [Noviherbaspirillum sp.]
MYRHLLVPIDNTDLSIATIGQAVEFARTLGARITFFHAQTNHVSLLHGDAEIVRLVSPADFSYNFEGRARELLTKAESAARAQGVPCTTATAVSDSPYSAILEAAKAEDCDLIFMASHGRRSRVGMVLDSQTLRVLINTEIPVLVSATTCPPIPAVTIGTIRDEHRSLAAVLHAWMHLLREPATPGASDGMELMKAMLYYIQAFPLELHHPKEQEYLFRKLRKRTSSVNAELDELERQHERDHQLVDELAVLLREYEAGNTGRGELEKAVSAYATFMWEHMGREEGVILPAAQRCLTDEDWEEINAAFCDHEDPRFGGDTDAQFRRLFSRIVNLAPSSNT